MYLLKWKGDSEKFNFFQAIHITSSTSSPQAVLAGFFISGYKSDMKNVVICGSQRYKEEIKAFSQRLRKLGVPVVFEPNFERQRKKMLTQKEKDRLMSKSYRDRVPAMVHEHFDRIRKADVCYVYNKDGYLGVNTTLELGFAHGKNMIIYALEPEKPIEHGGEVCRDILFTEIIDKPEELVKRLV